MSDRDDGPDALDATLDGTLDGTWRGVRGRAQLPLLDRLIDAEPDRPSDRSTSAAEALAVLRASIRTDLEALLNSRRRWRSWNPAYTELATSPIGFGLPDFAAGAFNHPGRREELRREVEATIRRFEPRFASLVVTIVGPADKLTSTLRLRIEALMHAEPAPEPISFETLVEATTTDVTVLASES